MLQLRKLCAFERAYKVSMGNEHTHRARGGVVLARDELRRLAAHRRRVWLRKR